MSRISLVIFFIIATISYNAFGDTEVTIYTPEGKPLPAHIMDPGSPWYTDEEALDDIRWYGLDAEIISSATVQYNCHGYAWVKSENRGTYWVGYDDGEGDPELSLFSDAAYSNDGQSSYISASSTDATQACYEPNSDHSVRVIQNSYPMSSVGSRTHVSKWGSGPLVRHAPGHDVYALKNTGIISYYKLKTIHYGTLTNYPKIWIGAGSRTHSLSGNIYVPSGCTLTLASSAEINTNGYGIYSTEGPIYVQSGVNGINAILKSGATPIAYFGTIQNAITLATSGQTVQLYASKTYNEALSFTSKSGITVQGQTGSVINGTTSITNSSNISLNGLSFNFLISINSSSGTYIHSTITPSEHNRAVMDYYGTNSVLQGTSVIGGGQAFAVRSNGGTGDISESSIIYNQNYEMGFECAVFLDSYASYNVATDNTFCGNGLDIDAIMGAYAYASNNTYSHSISQSVAGNVFVTGRTDVCSLAKMAVTNVSEATKEESNVNDEKYLSVRRNILSSKKHGTFDPSAFADNYKELIDGYKDDFVNGKDLKTKKNALIKLHHLYNEMAAKNDFNSFVASQENLSANAALKPYLLRYDLWQDIDAKDYTAALSVADKVIAMAGDDKDLSAEMLYEKGLVYKYYLSDTASAKAQFMTIVKDYPLTNMSDFAQVQLCGQATGTLPKQSTTETEQPTGYTLTTNPNPFNPSTTISFALPEAGRVSLKVYDIVGREVAQLVNERKEAGKYSVIFNANNLVSGMYFCRLEVGTKVVISKILLMK